MKKVFVTGANGLLGTNLILKLIEQNYHVKALLRDKNKFISFNHVNLQLVEGDLSDSNNLQTLIAGCDYVVHAAANTRQNLLSLSKYSEANVFGTKNILSACILNQIEKLVYVGTANTYGYGSQDNPGNENTAMKAPFTKSPYAQSKMQALKLVRKFSNQVNVTSISPTFIIGPFDTKPSSGKLILSVLDKGIAFYPPGGKNFIHVNDVVHAIIKAFDVKETGQEFILANENMTYKEFFKKVIHLNQQKTMLIKIPILALRILGIFGNIIRFLGIRTSISFVNTKILSIKNYYSNKKVRDRLELDFTPIQIAIKDALEFFNGDRGA